MMRGKPALTRRETASKRRRPTHGQAAARTPCDPRPSSGWALRYAAYLPLVVPRGKRGFLAGLPRRARQSGEQAATLVELSETQIEAAIAFAMLPPNAYISASDSACSVQVRSGAGLA